MIQAATSDMRGPAEGCIPVQYGEIISENFHSMKPLCTIRDVLWKAKSIIEAVEKNEMERSQLKCICFRTIARLICFWPSSENMQDLCIPKEACPEAILEEFQGSPPEWMFAGRATLEDPTGSLDVDIFGKEADFFFSEVSPAVDLRDPENENNRREILDSISRMHGNGIDSKHGTWLDVCFMMYWPEAEPLYPKFRIFDTVLKRK